MSGALSGGFRLPHLQHDIRERLSPPLPMIARSRLREATRAEHAAVDALFSRFDLSQAAGYRSFLRATASAHLGIEAALDAAGAARLVADWPERRRGDLLRADLADLGIKAGEGIAPPAFSSEAEVLGGIYVVEGSRLGGALLSSRIAPGTPARFLTAPARPGAWRNLLVLLDRHLDDPAQLELAVSAARACFRRFERAAISEMELLVA